MSDVNWSLGLQQGNAGDAFSQAFQQGQQTKQQNMAKAAMAALVADPNNDRALQALASVDPQAAQQFQSHRAQMVMQQAEQHRAAIMDGVPLYQKMGAPTDPAGWQRFKQAMAQTGHDVSQMPDQFDPQYVQGATAMYQAWSKATQNPNSVQEYEYAKQQGYGGGYTDFLQFVHPPSAMTIPYGATVSGGGGGSPAPVTATGPNGQKIQLNPQTNQWEPIGGQAATPPATFP